MSACQVSPAHIGAIVRWAVMDGPRAYREDADAAPALMADLAQECFNSVRYRYPTGPLPGPTAYADRPVVCHPNIERYRKLTPVEVLKAIDCLEYQSCEHPTWEQSSAYRWLQRIRGLAIAALPGYDAAPWGFDEDEPAAAEHDPCPTCGSREGAAVLAGSGDATCLHCGADWPIADDDNTTGVQS